MKKRPKAGEVTLDEYINGLRNWCCQTDDAVTMLGPAHGHASETLAITWEFLFDYLSQSKAEGRTLDDINTAAGIIFKLAQGESRLKDTEHMTLEFEEKLAERRARVRRELDALAQEPGVSPELLKSLERQLDMLG